MPNDVALLKQFIVERERQRESLISQIREEAARQLELQAQRNAAELKAAIAALLRRDCGPRNEPFDPRQLLFFGQRIDPLPPDAAAIAGDDGEPLVTRWIKYCRQHDRQQLPEALERIEIEHVDAWQGRASFRSASDLYVHSLDAESQRLMKELPFGDGMPAADAG